MISFILVTLENSDELNLVAENTTENVHVARDEVVVA